MDGNESTPARPHGDAGTKAATAEDGKATGVTEPVAPGGAPAPSEPDAGSTGSAPQQATAGDATDATPKPPAASTPQTPPAAPDPPTPPATTAAPTPPAATAATRATCADRATGGTRGRPGPGPDTVPAPGPPAYGAAKPEAPRIFDLPDHESGRRGNGADRPLVLGGAAAAEGRTSGSHPRIAGPATAPGGTGDGDEGDDEPRGRHFLAAGSRATERWPLLLAAVPILALVLLVGAWAIDTAALSGQVMRNVHVAGRDVGGLGEASLPEVMDEVNSDLASRPVVVTSGDRRYETTAGDIGLTVDTEATAQAALDAGRSDSLLTRPFSWLGSFFGSREVDVQYSVKESQVVAKMLELQGPELLTPHDPTIAPS